MGDVLRLPEGVEAGAGGVWAFRVLSENVADCVYLLDRECRCLAVNPAFSQWLERPDTEIVGQTVFDIWPRPLAVKEAAEHQRVLRGERIEQEEERPRGGGDSPPLAVVRSLKLPVRDDEDVVRGVLCLFRETPIPPDQPVAASVLYNRTSQTILVVDNEPEIVQLAQLILQPHGYRVLTAEDGPQAVEIFRANKAVIDVVILDQHMPGWSGVETMNELRTLNVRTRFLLMSGGPPPEPSWRSPTSGWSFLSKPWGPEQLVKAVREVLADPMEDKG